MDPFGNKGIFVGYYEVSKAFRIYVPGFHHMEINRDVTFDEEAAPRDPENVNMKKYMRKMHLPEMQRLHSYLKMRLLKNMTWQNHKNPLRWRYHERESLLGKERLYKKQKDMELLKAPQGKERSLRLFPIGNQEPTSHEEAIQKKEWVEVMTEEYQSIMKNDVWDIVPKTEGKSVVSSKWIYKIKQ